MVPRRCTLALEGSAPITRAAIFALSLSLSLPLTLPLLPPFYPSHRLRCVCLFIVVFWEIPDTSNGVSYARHTMPCHAMLCRTVPCRAASLAFPFWSCIRSVLGFLRDFEKRPRPFPMVRRRWYARGPDL